jgi:hypothetical protein
MLDLTAGFAYILYSVLARCVHLNYTTKAVLAEWRLAFFNILRAFHKIVNIYTFSSSSTTGKVDSRSTTGKKTVGRMIIWIVCLFVW